MSKLKPKTIKPILRLVVDLPTVKSAADIETDLEADNIVVDVAGLFYLDLPLPYTVDVRRNDMCYIVSR